MMSSQTCTQSLVMSYTVINYSDVIAKTPSSYKDNLISNQSGGELQRGTHTTSLTPSYSFSNISYQLHTPILLIKLATLSIYHIQPSSLLLSHYLSTTIPGLTQTLPTFHTHSHYTTQAIFFIHSLNHIPTPPFAPLLLQNIHTADFDFFLNTFFKKY